jgi:signal recognition particle subunit SEC65
VRTVQRWELELGLPVHRTSGGKRAPVFAFEQEIDHWLQQRPGILSEASETIVPIRPLEPVDQRNSKANGRRVRNDYAQLNPSQQRLIESVRELSQNALALEQQVGTRVLGPSSDTTGSLVTFEQLTKAVISIQKIMDALLTVEKLLNTAVAQSQVGITPATRAARGDFSARI